LISAATFTSRVLGFVRDVFIAQAFGAGLVADAFFVAFAIPSMFRRFLTEGALTSAFIPVYSDQRAQNGEGAARRFSGAMGLSLAAGLALICFLGIVFAGPLVIALAPGFARSAEKLGLTSRLTQVMFSFLFFIGLNAIATGVLNAARRFFLPALAPAIQNVAMIAALLLASGTVDVDTAVFWLAWSVVIGGALQLLAQIPLLMKLRIAPLPAIPWRTPGVGRCLRLMGPAAFGAAILQINVLVDRWLASFLAEGSISYLYYANRLVQFPHGMLSLAVTAAAFPVLSDRAARGRHGGGEESAVRDTLAQAGRLTLFITLPATMGLMALAHPIMTVLFERGAFGPEESAASAAALRAYALGLAFFGMVRLMASAYHAQLNTRYPVRCANWSVLAHVLLSLSLMGPLGYIGLALATSLASGLNAFLLYQGLQKSKDWPGNDLRRTAQKLLIASLLMGLFLVLLNWALWPDEGGVLLRGSLLAGEVLAGALGYLAICRLLAPELSGLWKGVFRRRIKRPAGEQAGG
jgi:putative peptidoglycan lipid II flippase